MENVYHCRVLHRKNVVKNYGSKIESVSKSDEEKFIITIKIITLFWASFRQHRTRSMRKMFSQNFQLCLKSLAEFFFFFSLTHPRKTLLSCFLVCNLFYFLLHHSHGVKWGVDSLTLTSPSSYFSRDSPRRFLFLFFYHASWMNK